MVPPAAGAAKRIILAHGACHGGWCWYKVAAQLRAAGHRVDAPDLGARRLGDAPAFADHARPLLDAVRALPDGERAVLVGHSFGGISVALAAETYPEKVAAAVFVAAFLPDCANPPSHPIDKHQESDWMDTVIDPSHAPPSILFGPEILKKKFYQLSSPQDYTLGMSLVRVSSLYVDDLRQQPAFREDRYGAVRKVYVVVKHDLAIVEEHQRWMIANAEVAEVKVMDAGDHMAMLSAPVELAGHLADVANRYT
ncbi:hypothetical protein E2562_023110 [Oryza meyeriana var. granulata]|uniref:AB hydrolase-1 domain-containing protein n=1 Tax=Oryza meyeriana var. granulata TaxID=110450 RepID=A0A6G1E0I3_9ORYZ|nr:hypothetical protein E2562_023110 [Oryza meyeriana var. granulata]